MPDRPLSQTRLRHARQFSDAGDVSTEFGYVSLILHTGPALNYLLPVKSTDPYASQAKQLVLMVSTVTTDVNRTIISPLCEYLFVASASRKVSVALPHRSCMIPSIPA
jgi:hypothetical protein